MRRARLAALAIALTATPVFATDFWVSALRGKDSNSGSFTQPFATVTKALSVAKAKDRVRVLPGRYSPSFGERFPLTVPDGVTLIGEDPRDCILDGEFDPARSSNPVTGTLVQLGNGSRLAYVSVRNGARDEGNPGKHWWRVAILAQARDGHCKNVTIDHVVVDRVSRAIVCGFASGDHDVQGVRIHDCVIQRFTVEGVNSWANKGTASGNLIYNCTLLGHLRSSNNKIIARASMSFGTNAQFDVRNCLCYQADWAGIEAVTSAKVTSDYNCLHGGAARGFVSHRGLKIGAKDLPFDPAIGAAPTEKLEGDYHQARTGVGGFVLWRRGQNQAGQTNAQELDYRGPRIQFGFVDIGADEVGGILTDAYFVGPARIGTVGRMAFPGAGQSTTIAALGFKSLAKGVTVPGIQGALWLDPALPILFTTTNNKGARGYASLPLPIPNLIGLRGTTLYLQGIELRPQPVFSDLDRIRITR